VARFYPELNEGHKAFIAAQKLFFTATAPREGRINLSPKGMDSFRCLDGRTVAYLDLTGSGNETAAHLRDDGRLTVMFCSFGDEPLILRLYGTATVVRPGEARWDQLVGRFPPIPGRRQIVLLHIESLQTSCGFGVPVYEFKEARQRLTQWAARRGEEGLADYRHKNNRVSIDGLPTGLIED